MNMKQLTPSRMKKVILIVLSFMLSETLLAQRVVLDEDLRDSTTTHFGPNQRHFVAAYIHLGGAIAYDDGVVRYDLKRFNSDVAIGAHYRLKLTSFLGIGAMAGLNVSQFFLDTDSVYTNKVNRYRQTYNGLEGGAFLRINIGKRGDYRGFYLDGGVKGQVNYYVEDKLFMDSDVANSSTLILRNPNAARLLVPSAFVHINYNHIGVYANYRLDELRDDFLVTPLTVGLRFDL
jgi:hypothetical protein